MPQNYPYYVAARIDAGQMVKMCNGKKFKSYMEAVDGMHNRCEAFKKILKNNIMETSQIVILEYSSQYQSKICTIYSFGKMINVSDPEEAI